MPTSALATDLYELTMLAGYDIIEVDARATFELSVRRLPPNRAFLVAAGLEQALEYLESLQFLPEQIAWLRSLPTFQGVSAHFFDHTLARLRFTGDVWAVPEGTPMFSFEPLLRVTAPLAEAQLVETALLGLITFQTSIASKAARIVRAAHGRPVMEFGSRRAHGPDAALHAARAAYLAGCAATSNVEAGYRFGVPLAGTMAHSWVKTFPSETSAFRAFMDVFGERAVLLIDTYDTLQAARRIVAEGLRPSAVRLDSGDLVALSREVRQIFDAGGLSHTRILASGDLDEWAITELLAAQAPIDGFGVGTSLSTSMDAPALGGIYKLVEIERAGMDIPVMKLSGGKPSFPGRKQVWRHGHDGHAVRDTIGLHDEPAPAGAEPLLQPVMRGGHRLPARPSLAASRVHHASQIATLPEALRSLDPPVQFPVAMSPALDALATRTIAHLTSPS